MKCDFNRRTSTGGTVTSWPFRNYTRMLIALPKPRYTRKHETNLAIFDGTRVQRHRAVREERLNFCHQEVAFLEECAHLQLVGF